MYFRPPRSDHCWAGGGGGKMWDCIVVNWMMLCRRLLDRPESSTAATWCGKSGFRKELIGSKRTKFK